MSDLIEFLKARLDSDERYAVDVRPVVGLYASGPTHSPGTVFAQVEVYGPGRARAEAAAKRAIIELHRLDVRRVPAMPFDPATGQPRPPESEVICAICGWASDDPTSACETLRRLAAAYRDHPEWREEWAA